MKKFISVLAVLAIFLVVSCVRQPYNVPKFVDIPTNGTAFIVPLNADTSAQSKFMSEEYLAQNKVATKRVQIPQEWVKTGRQANKGFYQPTISLIIVDRTPVSVTWTSSKNGGNDATKIGVESSESIGFTVPISLTAMIAEDDVPKFLNKYTPNMSLEKVVNTDVNAYIRTQASAKFGKLTVEQCKAQKADVLNSVFTSAKDFFAKFGITISQFGMTDGFLYDNENIQLSIDRQAQLQADGKALEEKAKNEAKQRSIDLANAQNEANIAATKASSVNALKAIQEVENSKIIAQAQADAIVEFAKNAKLPDVIPEGVFYNLGLDKLIPTNEGK